MQNEKLSKLVADGKKAQGEKANLNVSAPKKAVVSEQRTARLASYVRPSEKESFLNLIGRKSESDAIRELILKFIEG